ncbi:DUF1775 domain-containing protein [Microbacterium sp. RD1]|uniref:DUF1775 domain-containing protein n=1 Tax=Microbacterium sp. RD1 TaxID=3457313 RepID=UPI003FA53603
MSPTRPSPRPSRARRRARVLLGAAAGLTLAVGAPLAASAHIHVTPSSAAADSPTTLTFAFSHGCEDSPTTGIVVDIPDGVTNVVPVAAGGWTIERTLADNGTVTAVAFTAETPVESGLKGEVALDVRFDAALAETDVAFPVTQECVTGSTAWTQIAAEGEDEPESPAPVVSVGAVAPEGDHHSGGDASTTGHEGGHADDAEASPTGSADTAGGTDVAALWLGGGGLALGAAALVVALAALRRRRV